MAAVVEVQCPASKSIYISTYYPNMHILWPICMCPCKEGHNQDAVANAPQYRYLFWPSGHMFDHAGWCRCTDYHRQFWFSPTSLFSITAAPTRSEAIAKYDIARHNVLCSEHSITWVEKGAEQTWQLELNDICRKTNSKSFSLFLKFTSALWLMMTVKHSSMYNFGKRGRVHVRKLSLSLGDRCFSETRRIKG